MIGKKILRYTYAGLDKFYISLDKTLVRRTRNLRLVPDYGKRRGGKIAYGEWCHVIGIFQTILYTHMNGNKDNNILDVGCGTGIVGIACEPFLGKNGRYIGIDVSRADIDFCKKHFSSPRYAFQHLNVKNPTYSPEQVSAQKKWNVENNSMDMITALSVWTHLNEEDAIFYFNEINRVLKPGGKAIVTFFVLDDLYSHSLKHRTDAKGKFHSTCQNRWIFDNPSSESHDWFHTRWAKYPEDAIGITPTGIRKLTEKTNLTQEENYIGNWKEIRGVYFQDILVFRKTI